MDNLINNRLMSQNRTADTRAATANILTTVLPLFMF